MTLPEEDGVFAEVDRVDDEVGVDLDGVRLGVVGGGGCTEFGGDLDRVGVVDREVRVELIDSDALVAVVSGGLHSGGVGIVVSWRTGRVGCGWCTRRP